MKESMMNRTNVYAVRDNKMESFGKPIIMENNAVATRAFGDIITSDKQSMMSMHPADFSLYLLGEYEDSTGKFYNLDCPTLLATGSDFLNEKKD